MKSFRLQFLVLTSLAICTQAAAQHYVPTDMDAQRIEVTRSLDHQIPTDVSRLLAPYQRSVDSIMSPVLGRSSVAMTADRPESLLSNWVSDVLRHHSGRYGRMADIGLCNMGGLRSSMPEGDVTVGDIMEISPFQNTFCILTLKGSDLLDLFRQMAHSHGEGISGAQLDITEDGQLRSATVGGKPVKPNSTYRIATIDYLAEGNDGLTALKKAVKRDMKPELVRDVLTDFVREENAAGRQLTAAVEGRITVNGRRADSLSVSDAATQHSSVSLLVVHTNDTHSCIQPINPRSTDTQRADKAGYLRRVALIDNLRIDDPDLLLVDCGDFSQGSAYYNLFQGEVEVKLMNRMGYDAATIGNHEFDYGIDNMVRIFRMAQFPIVCCNYDFGSTPLRDIVKPYVVIQRKGLRIGILGVCPKLDGLVAHANYNGITWRDPITCANEVVAKLRQEEHCDLVLVLSHLGWEGGLADDMNDQKFISGTRNIDAVIGGHSHTYFTSPRYVKNLDGQPVPCNQMGKNGQFVGTLRFHFTYETDHP